MTTVWLRAVHSIERRVFLEFLSTIVCLCFFPYWLCGRDVEFDYTNFSPFPIFCTAEWTKRDFICLSNGDSNTLSTVLYPNALTTGSCIT